MAANAASERFRRDFDAELIAPRLRDFLLGSHPAADGAAPLGVSNLCYPASGTTERGILQG